MMAHMPVRAENPSAQVRSHVEASATLSVLAMAHSHGQHAENRRVM